MKIPGFLTLSRSFKLGVSSCFLLVFSIQASASKPDDLGLSSERLERVDDVFEQYVADQKLPGAVLLVARKGEVAYFNSFGSLDPKEGSPMPKNAIFRIASQTKAIVSVGIMMLQEEGKLLINDPLSKYIPEFKETTVAEPTEEGGYEVVPAKREITLRDLLNHSSGVGYGHGLAEEAWKEAGIQDWYFANRDEPIAATIERMAKLPMDAQPGEQFVYGYSTDILGVVIERASGMDLNEFLSKKIITPLGMKDTHFYLPEDKADRLAAVYEYTPAKGLQRAPVPGLGIGQGAYLEGPRKSYSGGAGLLSTAEDYLRFLEMLANGGELDGVRLLSPKSIELMTVNHLPDGVVFPWGNGMGFGLGFSIIEDLGQFGELGSEGAFGWGGAYHSTYWIDPKEDLVVVYFSQVIPADGLDDHAKLRALIYQSIVD